MPRQSYIIENDGTRQPVLEGVAVPDLSMGLFLPNVTTPPPTPVNGVVIYAENGVLKVKNAAGTPFTIGG